MSSPAKSAWYWWRLPERDRERLREAVDGFDFTTVLAVLNRYQIAPNPLSLCCDLEAAVTHARAYLDHPENHLKP